MREARVAPTLAGLFRRFRKARMRARTPSRRRHVPTFEARCEPPRSACGQDRIDLRASWRESRTIIHIEAQYIMS